MPLASVYLIPCPLHPSDDALRSLSPEILYAVKQCTHFFVEQPKTARRFLKKLWPEIFIDNYRWTMLHKVEEQVTAEFREAIYCQSAVGIISEAGCPGIADPGQRLVAVAQKEGASVIPLTGPNSLILSLMASGLNGQQFSFHGYLPIDSAERKNKIKAIELLALREKSAHLIIETPYRNDALLKDMLQILHPSTLLCLAVDLYNSSQSIRTLTVAAWKKNIPALHKIPVVFIIGIEK